MNNDTPLTKRAYNLGLKAVSNFVGLSEEQIKCYEQNLDEIPDALARGFIIPPTKAILVETPLDFIIRVVRSIKPRYPDWMKKLMQPELELAGPTEYDLQTAVKQWLHGDDQEHSYVVGYIIYKHLKDTNALASCLNLQDGLAIKQKGIAVFRKFFCWRVVFLWGSVVQDRHGNLYVPYLCEDGDRVVLGWRPLYDLWQSLNPALRFGK